MRRIGVPVVIRITDDMLEVARRLAAAKNKPLRTLLHLDKNRSPRSRRNETTMRLHSES